MENLNMYLLGRLDSNVFENSRGFLQFIIKSQMEEPREIVKDDRYNCFVESIYKYGLIEREDESIEESLYSFLEDKLVIFTPSQGLNPSTLEEIIVKKPVDYDENYLYRAIPLYSKKKLKIDFLEFVEKLKEREWISAIEKVEEGEFKVPNIIFFEDERKIYALTGLKSQVYKYGKVKYDYEVLYAIEEEEAWYDSFVRSADCMDIVFVEKEKALEIESLAKESNLLVGLEKRARLKKEEEGLKEEISREESLREERIKALEKEIREEDLSNSGLKLKEELLLEDLREREIERREDLEELEEEREPLEKNKEDYFLEDFMKTCKEMGLIYEERDLINFHTAMKASKLVILSGMSGTGKSKIVQAYGRALGLKKENLNFISVRPSFGDDSDLLGYVDSINNIYRPGDSGFIDTLIEASENKESLYIVCLDEMNLARVEHYFSQILSLLELDKEDRILRLYNEELEEGLKNSKRYKAKIKLLENLLLVGTVNLDESTYHLSDKVLDRANVITLKQESFLALKNLKKEEEEEKKREEISFKDYEEMIKNNEEMALKDRELEFLSEIHERMNFLNKNIGIGFRIVRQIDDYIKNLPKNSIISRKEGFDIQLAQRILPKIRGTKEQWGEFLGEYDLYEDKNPYNKELKSELLKILEKYKDISDFKTSKEQILMKARELSIYGYTL